MMFIQGEKKNLLTISTLIFISFICRLIFNYYISDTHLDNEWSILVNNLINNKSYAFYNFDGELIPSVYMPPLYPFCLYVINLISFDKLNFISLVIFFQLLLSLLSIYIFYKINLKFFSEKLSLINASFFSFFPLNIYAAGQISSINLQITLSLLFLYFLILLNNDQNKKTLIFFSIVSGLLILTRGEFILIFLVFVTFLFLKKKIQIFNLIKIILIVVLVISPYLVRNYTHFNKVVIVKSLGFNLWKGNNHLSTPQGFENLNGFNSLKTRVNKIEKNKNYEIQRDKIFLEEAKKNLLDDPLRYLELFIHKIVSYYFIDMQSTYPNYFNIFHIVPVLFLSILSLPGFFIAFRKNLFEMNCLNIYLALNLIIFSIFFVLPRYKLIIIPIQIILVTYFIKYLLCRINRRNL